MKIRTGFVSNSSSASFVIIGSGDPMDIPSSWIHDSCLKCGEEGCTEFGWGPEILTHIQDRLNLACQLSKDHEDLREMLLQAIQEKHPEVTSLHYDPEWGYVDHQSEETLLRIFNSKQELSSFIFNCDSEIKLDNDNRYFEDCFKV